MAVAQIKGTNNQHIPYHRLTQSCLNTLTNVCLFSQCGKYCPGLAYGMGCVGAFYLGYKDIHCKTFSGQAAVYKAICYTNVCGGYGWYFMYIAQRSDTGYNLYHKLQYFL